MEYIVYEVLNGLVMVKFVILLARVVNVGFVYGRGSWMVVEFTKLEAARTNCQKVEPLEVTEVHGLLKTPS